jgi:hypothetical protein
VGVQTITVPKKVTKLGRFQGVCQYLHLSILLTKIQVSGNVTAKVHQDKQNINTMTSMHSTPAKGNFCVEHGKAQKLVTASVWTNLTT